MVDNVSSEHLSKLLESAQQSAEKLQQTSGDADSASFQDLVNQLITEVDQVQQQADQSIENLAAGDENTSIQDVVSKMKEADMAFRLMHEIRDKLVQAYKTTVKM